MGLALTIARRSLLRRPGRTLFSVLGIALGIATVVGVVTLDHNTITGYALPRQAADRPDIELAAAGGVVGTSEELAQLEGVSLASRFFQSDAAVRTGAPGDPFRGNGPDANAEVVQLFALEAARAPAFGAYRLAAGRDLAPGADEVLLGGVLAEALGIGLGDRVFASRLRRPSRKRCENGELVTIAEEPDRPVEAGLQVVGILTRERLGRRAQGKVAIVDYPLGERLFRGARIQPRFWATKDPGVDLERLRRTLAESYSYALNEGVVIGQAADERAFRTGVRMVGLLALVLGLYVIFHTLSMSLVERVTEVGTLHALGTSRGQIARVFLVEAVLLAGAGAAAGLALGLALAWALLRAGITTLGVGKFVPGFEVPWSMVLSLAAIGFVVALVGSVYPLLAVGGADTLAAVRGEEALRRRRGVALRFHLLYAMLLGVLLPALYLVVVPVVGELTGELVGVLLGAVGLLTFVVLLSLLMPFVLSGVCAALTRPFAALWPLAGRLAARAMREAPARIGVSASALGLVAAGLVGLKGMTNSLHGEIDVWADEALADKVWIRHLPPTSFDDLEAHLHRFGGVLGVEKGNARQYSPFLLLGVDVDAITGYGPLADAPELARRLARDRTVILSRRVAQDLEYAVGDGVQVTKANGQVATFEVIAISDAYGHWPDPDERMYGVVADRWMENDFCLATDVVTEVAVRLGEGGDLGVLHAAVRDLYPEADQVEFRTGAEVRAYHQWDLTRDFVLFDLLLGLTAVLAALGVLNGQLLAALERGKELGVLKAIGTSSGQLAGMVLLEALVVGVVGGALGVALGAGATPLVVGALESIAGLALPFRSAGPWLTIAWTGTIALAVAAALYPAHRVRRVDAVRAVRTG